MLSRALQIFSIRSLTPDDLQYVGVPKVARKTIQKIRNAHHTIARLAAAGLSVNQIAEKVGYTLNRISTLLGDPSMNELIARYRSDVNDSWVASLDSYHDLCFENMVMAERQIADRLEDSEASDPLPIRDLISISRDAADRLGYGKKTTQTNINIDFAARLEKAIQARDNVVTLDLKKAS